MSEHVTTGEFARWMNHLDAQNRQIIATQTAQLLEAQKTNGRVTALEANQESAGKLSAKVSAGVGIIVAGIIQGALAAIGGK